MTALRTLRHPSRSKVLRDYAESQSDHPRNQEAEAVS